MERQGVHGSCLRRRHGGRTETANLRTDERVAPSAEAIVPETRFQTQRRFCLSLSTPSQFLAQDDHDRVRLRFPLLGLH